jgi:hypothetical protein
MIEEPKPLMFDTLENIEESLTRILNVAKKLRCDTGQNTSPSLDFLKNQLVIYLYEGKTYLRQEVEDYRAKQVDYRKQNQNEPTNIKENLNAYRPNNKTLAHIIFEIYQSIHLKEALENILKSEYVIDLLTHNDNKLFVLPIQVVIDHLGISAITNHHRMGSGSIINLDIIYELTNQEFTDKIKSFFSEEYSIKTACIKNHAIAQISALVACLNPEKTDDYIRSAKDTKKYIENYQSSKSWTLKILTSCIPILAMLPYTLLRDRFLEYQLCLDLSFAMISLISFIKCFRNAVRSSKPDFLDLIYFFEDFLSEKTSSLNTFKESLDKTILYLEKNKNQEDKSQSKNDNNLFWNSYKENNPIKQAVSKNVITQCFNLIVPK